LPNPRGIWINKNNIIGCSIYFAVRHCLEHTWINHNDQFLYPNKDYENDIEFKDNCLIYTLFGGKNNIQLSLGLNHWIPFTEKEVGAKEKFESNFMSSFLKNHVFSGEAQAVLAAGLKIWKYYHKIIKTNKTASVNASFYDIRVFFQGRDDKGRMNSRSKDEYYNDLMTALRDVHKVLAQKIIPNIYKYNFLNG
jgi:hypothetical protein